MMELLFDANTDPLPVIQFATKEKAQALTGFSNAEFSGSEGVTLAVRANGKTLLWAGLGNAGSIRENTLRVAAAAAARTLARSGHRRIAIVPGDYGMYAKEIVEGALLGSYHYNRFKTKNRTETGLETLCICGLDALEQEKAREGATLGAIVNRARDRANTPPNMMAPADIATIAEDTIRRTGATMTIFDEFELKEKGFGALSAVGSGSANPPRLILLERQMDPTWPTIAIVGKTITFDSGGLSIKPAKGMDEEKWDKSGGIAALGIMEAITALHIPVNTVILLCAAENMPGPNACRPGDVITTYGGTTVEIVDTDAEGRLVLADGMAYAVEKFHPDLLLDLATLTGAVCIALGEEHSGLFTPDDELAATFHTAGETSGDHCWRLPLGTEFSSDLESRIADLRNTGTNRNGGSSKAAAFLEHFKGDSRWVHLDIANTAMPEHDTPTTERGATGAGIRLVTEALRKLYPSV
jgi:leucyl aminopeptidase